MYNQGEYVGAGGAQYSLHLLPHTYTHLLNAPDTIAQESEAVVKPRNSWRPLSRACRVTRGSVHGDLCYAPQIACFSVGIISTAFKMGQ